ncbi:hypothetical protein Taro_039857 [Colocasia esculenta]|uniref:Uncharacterized protein n=1 Tax=Colocasia esculenta TaxID=4460 RepID=A0A843WAD5_COLES|nr:hypothetical protein [Colocasia esculenta]
MTICAGRSRHNGEEEWLGVGISCSHSCQELLHTTPTRCKLIPKGSDTTKMSRPENYAMDI